MNTNVFLLFLSFVFSLSSNWKRERERVYKIGHKEKQSQSYLSYLMDSCGESFFFYGLTDFILFLVPAWRNGSFVSEIFFCLLLPGVLGFSSVRHEPCSTTTFLIIYFRWREGVPTSVLGSQPIIWLLSSSPMSGDFLGLLDVTQVRLLSTDSLTQIFFYFYQPN